MAGTFYDTLRSNILNLFGTLSSGGVSDNDTLYVHCRLRGASNNMDILGQWQCGIAQRRGVGRQGVISTGVVRLDPNLLQLLLFGILEKAKGETRALWGETR